MLVKQEKNKKQKHAHNQTNSHTEKKKGGKRGTLEEHCNGVQMAQSLMYVNGRPIDNGLKIFRLQ